MDIREFAQEFLRNVKKSRINLNKFKLLSYLEI